MKNRVREYREIEKLTQEELAEKSEVSRNTISALETGTNTNVTYETMSKIARALNRKVATIFFWRQSTKYCAKITTTWYKREEMREMEVNIVEDLKEIVEREVKKCNENKEVPSQELLDTIKILIILGNC